MVPASFTEHWDRLLVRDYLIAHPEAAAEYAALKTELAERYPADREAYLNGKAPWIERVLEQARMARREEKPPVSW